MLAGARRHFADAGALGALEQRLDGPVSRTLRRLLASWHGRAKPARRNTHRLPVAPGSAPALGDWLEQALASGALETAGEAAARLSADADELSRATPITLARVIEALLMRGEREVARELARAQGSRLAITAAGQSTLELLGLGASDWLPDGTPHWLRLSRRIAADSMSADELARIVLDKPWLCLKAPDVHLLFFSALVRHDGAAAGRFLSRFLGAYDSPPCELKPGKSSNVLRSLSFAPASPRSTGRRVSVVVAARNSAATIEYAIESLLAQSHRELEILVGDDASDDETLPLLQDRFGPEPRVRLFRSSRQQGSYNLRNALARRARGDYLTFHDADDLALPDRIARQVAQLARPSVRVCVGNFARVTPEGHFVFFKDQKATRLCPVSLMLERRTFDSVGPFRSAKVGADLELYAALCARFGPAGISRLRAPLMFGLSAAGSATRSVGSEALEDGYRSAARRAYSELVFAQGQPERRSLTDSEVEERLRATGNFIDRAEVLQVG
jgi:hypothetical protein